MTTHCTGPGCRCCADRTRAELLAEARRVRLEPTRPIKEPAGPVVINGAVVDLTTATGDQLLAACREVAKQFKDVVERQREHLRRIFSDSTATDGFKVSVSTKKEASRAD